MDFFNKLGKKASQTYQVTKEKTAKFSEEMKMKSKINDAKSEITSLYEEIGACVYNQFKTNTEEAKDEIKEKCEKISEKYDEISKLETEILALKEVKKCDKCGSEINTKDAFCSKCGKEQPKVEEVEVEVQDDSQEEVKEAEVTEIKDAEVDISDEKNNVDVEE